MNQLKYKPTLLTVAVALAIKSSFNSVAAEKATAKKGELERIEVTARKTVEN